MWGMTSVAALRRVTALGACGNASGGRRTFARWERREMNATRKRSPWMVAAGLVAGLALTFTPIGNAQAVDVGGSASGTGTFPNLGLADTLTLAVTGTPQGAAGPVIYTSSSTAFAQFSYTGEARCIAIDETPTGFRASIAGAITGGPAFVAGFRGFELVVYDNTPSAQPDQTGNSFFWAFVPRTDCTFDHDPGGEVLGDYLITPGGACPPNDDDDGDGLTNNNESLVSTLLGNDDSDSDGISDGNDDANGNGDDDEDEDDDENDGCPDEDSDDDGEDDEDEDDEEDDDDD
jgi:hypothetical protein